MSGRNIEMIVADLEGNAEHRAGVALLLEAYARDAMGLGRELPAGRARVAVEGLMGLATSRVFLAKDAGAGFVGMAVCFITFSTFSACRAMNVHDVIVRGDFRRRGIGRGLLEFAIAYCEAHDGAGKTTLEVRMDNGPARAMYRGLGFGPGDEPYEFWTRSKQ